MPLICPLLNKPCIETECNLWSVYVAPANKDPKFGPILSRDLDLSMCAFLATAKHAQADMALKMVMGFKAGRELGYIEDRGGIR
jgi:hypothetical protein